MTSNSWTVKFGRIWSVKCDVCSAVLGSARLEVTDKFGDFWVSFPRTQHDPLIEMCALISHSTDVDQNLAHFLFRSIIERSGEVRTNCPD